MTKCEQAHQQSLSDESIIGWECFECGGDGHDDEGVCKCCNGRGTHSVIRVPKQKGIK